MNNNPTNAREAHVKSQLEEMGYRVIRNGWPDMVAIKDGFIRFIEVKSKEDKLRPEQDEIHKILRRLGIRVEVMRVGDSDIKSHKTNIPTFYGPHAESLVKIKGQTEKEIHGIQIPFRQVINSLVAMGIKFWESEHIDKPKGKR